MKRATLVIPDNATIKPKTDIEDKQDKSTPKRTKYPSVGDIVTRYAEVDKWSQDGIDLLALLVTGTKGNVSNEEAGIDPKSPHPDNVPNNGQRQVKLRDPGSGSRSGTVRVYASDGTLQAELTSLGKRVLWCNEDYARKHDLWENWDVPTDNVQTVTDTTNLAIAASGWDQDN